MMPQTILHHAYTHLEKPGSFVRILFVLSFNTIQPHLMAANLLAMPRDAPPHPA